MAIRPPESGTPRAEVVVDEAKVRQLLEVAHPDLAALPIVQADSGWDNFIFRLGEHLAVRLPRHEAASRLTLIELRWLPVLAPVLPVSIPAALRTGGPTLDYPWSWSVVPWMNGMTSDISPLSSDQTDLWAAFLRALHTKAPADAPHNWARGVLLSERSTAFEARFSSLNAIAGLIPSAIRQIWEAGVSAPRAASRVWLHGDLHARNVLNVDGRITAVIDWGDLTGGDAATDLASVWTLFALKADREALIAAYGEVEAGTWERARAWAALFALAHLEAGLVDNPPHRLIGEHMLANLCDD